jgi:hypothetical protein
MEAENYRRYMKDEEDHIKKKELKKREKMFKRFDKAKARTKLNNDNISKWLDESGCIFDKGYISTLPDFGTYDYNYHNSVLSKQEVVAVNICHNLYPEFTASALHMYRMKLFDRNYKPEKLQTYQWRRLMALWGYTTRIWGANKNRYLEDLRGMVIVPVVVRFLGEFLLHEIVKLDVRQASLTTYLESIGMDEFEPEVDTVPIEEFEIMEADYSRLVKNNDFVNNLVPVREIPKLQLNDFVTEMCKRGVTKEDYVKYILNKQKGGKGDVYMDVSNVDVNKLYIIKGGMWFLDRRDKWGNNEKKGGGLLNPTSLPKDFVYEKKTFDEARDTWVILDVTTAPQLVKVKGLLPTYLDILKNNMIASDDVHPEIVVKKLLSDIPHKVHVSYETDFDDNKRLRVRKAKVTVRQAWERNRRRKEVRSVLGDRFDEVLKMEIKNWQRNKTVQREKFDTALKKSVVEVENRYELLKDEPVATLRTRVKVKLGKTGAYNEHHKTFLVSKVARDKKSKTATSTPVTASKEWKRDHEKFTEKNRMGDTFTGIMITQQANWFDYPLTGGLESKIDQMTPHRISRKNNKFIHFVSNMTGMISINSFFDLVKPEYYGGHSNLVKLCYDAVKKADGTYINTIIDHRVTTKIRDDKPLALFGPDAAKLDRAPDRPLLEGNYADRVEYYKKLDIANL